MAESVIRPIGWFKESRNVRQGMNETSLRELGESILKNGQLQDVIAQPDGTLIFGHRRLAAAKLCGGIDSLTVKIVENEVEAGRVLILQAIENEQRENLTEPERWRMVEEIRRLYPKWMAKDIAEALHKDSAWVTRYLSPSKCIPAVQEAFEAGRLGSSEVYAISRASERDQHELLAMKLGGATRDEVVRAVNRHKRPNGNGVRLSRIRCPLTSGTVVLVSGVEIGLEEGIEALTAAVKEMKLRSRRGSRCENGASGVERSNQGVRRKESVMRAFSKVVPVADFFKLSGIAGICWLNRDDLRSCVPLVVAVGVVYSGIIFSRIWKLRHE